MRHQSVGDFMTASVVRVQGGTGVKEIARLLTEHHITAVPVVDRQDHPVGMVSEADLLHKEAEQSDPAGHVPAPELPREDGAKVAAVNAEGLMTSPAVVARPQWSIVEAARTMEHHRVKRLPVVDDAGQLIGIVSRSDLMRVFLRRDLAIREEILDDVLTRTLGVAPAEVTAYVTDGRVTLTGTVEHKSLIPIAVRLCQSVDGVVDVTNRLTCEVGDTERPATKPQ